MKGSLKRFIKKTSKIQRIAIIAAVMVMVGAIASVSYISTQAALDDTGMYYTTSDGLWNYVWDRENNYKITIIGYNGTDTDIVFPSKTYIHQNNGTVYSDVKVKFEAIDTYTYDSTFFHNIEPSEVTSVTIPSNITEIGDYVFQYCESLTSVTLPDTLTSIGNWAFSYCRSLESIALPDTLTSMGQSVFSGCRALSEFNFPSKLTYIPNCAFENTSIKSVVIPYGYTSIGHSAFYECDQLVNVVIPQSVKKIDSGAFNSCTSLEKAVIPNSVTEFGGGVFQDCKSLKSATLSKNITIIPYMTFYNCTSLTEVKNIGNITDIYGNAFYNCTSLTTLDLPDTLTSIYYAAFQKSAIDPCSLNLKNVSSIESYAFAETTFSGEFTIPEKVTYLYQNIFRYANVPKLTIPSTVTGLDSSSIREAYIKELVWDTTINIPYQCMRNNTTLEKLTITKDINYIEDYAFEQCTSLKEVNAKNIGALSHYSFQHCTALTAFKANTIKYINYFAFYNCESLVTFDAQCIVTIGYGAFSYCDNLTNINKLIQNTKTIDTRAFQYCLNLGDVTLGGSLNQLNDNAFYNSGVTNVDSTNFMGTPGGAIFLGCSKLEEVYWNNTCPSGMFQDCTSLTKVTFGPRSDLTYANSAFYNCTALTDIYYLSTTQPSSIPDYFMNTNTTNIETIHYYKIPTISDINDKWISYLNYRGDSYDFVLDPMEPPTTPKVSSITIEQADSVATSNGKDINVGESMQLSALITYSDNTQKLATADDVAWKSSNPEYVTIDKTGKLSAVKYSDNTRTTISVISKEADVSAYIYVNVTQESTDTEVDLSAKKITLNELLIDNTTVTAEYNQQQFIDNKPFAMDWGNNGINNNSYSHIRFNVYPANTTDEVKVEITEGSDLITVAEPSFEWSNSNYSRYVSGITHIADDDGNYNYGTITIKVTAGDAEPLIYTFELEEETKIPTGVSFDTSGSQTQIEVGKTYDYTAFPKEWYEGTGNPYMWYDITYSIDDTDLADLSVADVEDAAYDANKNKYYTAQVATITPKKPGTIKLKAHSGRYVYNYTELTITITDPDNLSVVERPEQSEDPDEIWATSVTFPQDTITLAVGKTRNLSPTITPTNHTDELNYYSYDKSIASIDVNTGLITANAVGETTIGVSTSSGLHASVKVIVVDNEVPTTSVKLTPATLALKAGDSSVLQATIAPADTTDIPVWTSSDTNVVTVNAGAVTAVGQGTATVTVTSGNYSASCTINVNLTATGVTLSQTTATIKHGETLQLNATVEPAGITETVTWKSSNEKIATVSSTGKVTAVGYGDVDITVTVGKVTNKCTVSVVPTLNFKILGASIRVSDPYGIRFGIQLGKTGDYGDVKIVEYGTVMMPTEKLGDAELSLATPQVLKVQGKTIYSETSSELVYTGVLINIPDSFFNTDVSGRGYLTYEDTAGVQHTIYTDVVSRSFTGVAQSAYDSYSKITNPTTAQLNVLAKLKEILNIK